MSDQPFPPADPTAFLTLCAGEWMSLRSSFELSAGGDDEWHSSERGELVVRFERAEEGGLGQLQVTAPRFQPLASNRRDGHQRCRRGNGVWPDGSMELNLLARMGWWCRSGSGSFCSRLRSTTAVDSQGLPLQGSFCTDIRRVRNSPPDV